MDRSRQLDLFFDSLDNSELNRDGPTFTFPFTREPAEKIKHLTDERKRYNSYDIQSYEESYNLLMNYAIYNNLSNYGTDLNISNILLFDNSLNDSGKIILPPSNFSNEIWQNVSWWGIVAILVLLLTVMGNILVILAISWDRRLQNMTNYFLMSLAVTDLMVAVLVMPFAIVELTIGTTLYLVLCSVIYFDLNT